MKDEQKMNWSVEWAINFVSKELDEGDSWGLMLELARETSQHLQKEIQFWAINELGNAFIEWITPTPSLLLKVPGQQMEERKHHDLIGAAFLIELILFHDFINFIDGLIVGIL
jgi:hypothetical protein